jgi:IS1 family transposase
MRRSNMETTIHMENGFKSVVQNGSYNGNEQWMWEWQRKGETVVALMTGNNSTKT